MKKSEVVANIRNTAARSAWNKGVKSYALDLLADLPDEIPENPSEIKALMLNGASDWTEYSYSGCALVDNGDIVWRLGTPSQNLKTGGGERRPNGHETWLDVQARALSQAAQLIYRSFPQEV